MGRKRIDKAINQLVKDGFTVSELAISQETLNAVHAIIDWDSGKSQGGQAFIFHIKDSS